jgi:hypothetical protein
VDGVAKPAEDFDTAFAAFTKNMRQQPPQVMRAIKSLSLGAQLESRGPLDAAETMHFVKVWTHPDHWAAVAAIMRRERAE